MLTADSRPEPPAGLRCAVLGPLTVRRAGEPVALGARKQQQVLAMLLCRPNAVTSVDLLTAAVWADEPPRTAHKNLQVYIASLRKLLDVPDRILHRNGGYLLRASAEELDLLEFSELLRQARAATDIAERVRILAAVLRLWRGPALDGMTGNPQLAAEVDRLSLQYVAAFESWADGELALGNPHVVVEPAAELALRYPIRERLRQLQMTALYRADRVAEALEVFHELRQTLARELGLHPSVGTERLYCQMLDGSVEHAGQVSDRPAGSIQAPVLLPPRLTDFTDRREEVRAIEEQLTGEQGQNILITGPVGIGKSTLALRVAHRAGQLFPAGRIFVSLRDPRGTARSGRSVLLHLLRLVGQSGLEGCELEELVDRWQGWVAGRELLLVLDDAWDSSVLRAVLPMAGTSRALITSRRRLPSLEYTARIELSALPPIEAVRLLGRIIGARRVAAEARAADRIVRAVDCLPLAIRTAGSKLDTLRHVSLAEFAARLQHPDNLLAELATTEEMLRSRLAVALTDLSEGEWSALRRLGALEQSRFTTEQAATVLAEAPSRARRVMESLIETHILTIEPVQPARYELSSVLRCYVRELAAG